MTVPIVVMGVSAAGKTLVGRALAAALGRPFVDGDDLHPPANVARMAAGSPLTDEHRRPWLDAIATELADRPEVVVACSALRREYRDRLRRSGPLRFVHLDVDPAELRRRIAERTDHFMPPSLLADQLATLESPAGEPHVIVVDANGSRDEVVTAAIAAVDE